MDNLVVSRRMLPDRVKQLLDSEDIEMVKLGATMMKEFVPMEFWHNVLEMFSFHGGSDYELLYVRKWTFTIHKDEINITPADWYETKTR